MIKCTSCDKPLTSEEIKECNDICIECDIVYHIGRVAFHITNDRINFEDAIRQLISEMDNE